jgi:aryl-alcohol dehydrogenase-like predicted oxidoreductase
VPHSLSADDALGPVLDAYRQMQHTGKTRFIGISAMEPDVPTVRQILHSGHFDTVLAYYNLLNWTAQEPAPPGVALWDNGQIIPLATALNLGVIGIRSHAAGALSPQVDRPISPGTLLAHDVVRAQTLGFLLEGSVRTLSQAAMVFCLMNRAIATTIAWRKKCGRDGRTGGVCRPSPDSAAASRALAGTLRPWLSRLKHIVHQFYSSLEAVAI